MKCDCKSLMFGSRTATTLDVAKLTDYIPLPPVIQVLSPGLVDNWV
jgi:hypothetical protein